MLRAVWVSAGFVMIAAACGGASRERIGSSSDDGGAKSDTGVFGGDGGGIPGACVGLECQIPKCSGEEKTRISGVVVAPTPAIFGKADPIYNAIVYIPNDEVEPFTEGVSCDKCGTPVSGKPISVSLTNEVGEFTLEDVPAGEDIPLVIQIGRWRRQVTIPAVDECTDNALPKELTRLPRNKKEGDIPLIAVATSPYDPTECILRKIGIDEEEFTGPSGDGRVHIYEGRGATIAGAAPMNKLYATGAQLAKYDLVALPCSSNPTDATGMKNVVDYASAGGRVYLTDLSYPAISNAPEWAATAEWTAGSDFGSITGTIDTSFAKGKAMARWLKAIGATPVEGTIQLEDTYSRFSSVNAPAQRWIQGQTGPQTYSFNAPVQAEEEEQCGRVAYSSFHIAASGSGGISNNFPDECTAGPLTAQEKALEFMLFDLSSCVQKDDKPPVIPPK